jgi:hypothetical protein
LHLGDSLLAKVPELQDQDKTEIKLTGRPFKIRRQLLGDLASHTIEGRISSLGKPLLVMHSPKAENSGDSRQMRYAQGSALRGKSKDGIG